MPLPNENDPTAIVLSEQCGSVCTLALNSPPHNLVGPELLAGILKSVDAAIAAGARCIVVKSATRNFSAGADLTLFERPPSGEKSDKAVEKSLGPTIPEFLSRMEAIPLPVIASIHGVCLGGGLEIALTADYIIAARSARLGSVEATLGLQPIMGGIQRQVERVGLIRAKEMSMLGRRYDPETLERWNLINLVVDDDKLEATTMAVAEELGNGPTVAFRTTKALALVAANQGIAAADAAMADIQKPMWKSEDLRTGMDSFMKRGPGLARFGGR